VTLRTYILTWLDMTPLPVPESSIIDAIGLSYGHGRVRSAIDALVLSGEVTRVFREQSSCLKKVLASNQGTC